MKTINLLIILLLAAAMAFPQHRLMQVHSAGEVAYEINTAQVDSVVFKNGEPVEIPFTEYSLAGTSCQWANLGYDNKVIIINDNEELKNYIECTGESDYPEVDFSKHTLLLARGGTTSGIHAFEKQLQQISINEYSLYVDITLNMTAVAQGWFISIKALKLSQEVVVTLNINEHF